jgi:hypothetical protein
MRRDTLQFDPNVPRTLALKYQTGREVSNGRIMFSTTEDEVFFLDANDAAKVHALGLGQNEPFRILKRVTGSGKSRETSYVISRAEDRERQQQSGSNRPAATATPARQPAPAASVSGGGDQQQAAEPSSLTDNRISMTKVMASSYVAAIDAVVVAKDYAEKKGVSFRVTEEEIRASAHCIFIQFWRSKEHALREKEHAAKYAWKQNGNGNGHNGGAQWQQQ